MPRQEDSEWIRKKYYLAKSMIATPLALSPIAEEPSGTTLIEEIVDGDDVDPFPDLIIERARKRHEDDESDEFYKKFEGKIQRYYKKYFLEGNVPDDSVSSFDASLVGNYTSDEEDGSFLNYNIRRKEFYNVETCSDREHINALNSTVIQTRMPDVTQQDESASDESDRIPSLTPSVSSFEIMAQERTLCKQVGSTFADNEEHVQQKHTEEAEVYWSYGDTNDLQGSSDEEHHDYPYDIVKGPDPDPHHDVTEHSENSRDKSEHQTPSSSSIEEFVPEQVESNFADYDEVLQENTKGEESDSHTTHSDANNNDEESQENDDDFDPELGPMKTVHRCIRDLKSSKIEDLSTSSVPVVQSETPDVTLHTDESISDHSEGLTTSSTSNEEIIRLETIVEVHEVPEQMESNYEEDEETIQQENTKGEESDSHTTHSDANNNDEEGQENDDDFDPELGPMKTVQRCIRDLKSSKIEDLSTSSVPVVQSETPDVTLHTDESISDHSEGLTTSSTSNEEIIRLETIVEVHEVPEQMESNYEEHEETIQQENTKEEEAHTTHGVTNEDSNDEEDDNISHNNDGSIETMRRVHSPPQKYSMEQTSQSPSHPSLTDSHTVIRKSLHSIRYSEDDNDAMVTSMVPNELPSIRISFNETGTRKVLKRACSFPEDSNAKRFKNVNVQTDHAKELKSVLVQTVHDFSVNKTTQTENISSRHVATQTNRISQVMSSNVEVQCEVLEAEMIDAETQTDPSGEERQRYTTCFIKNYYFL